MSDGEKNNSGELTSFLHLTGWRPLVLALIAGLAGAYGLFTALSEPAQFQARYVINVNRVAEDGLLPQELDIFAREIAQTARFPQIESEVEAQTGLVNEEDYDITVNQSGASANFIDVNVVSGDPVEAEEVAVETGIATLDFTLRQIVEGQESARDRIQEEVDELDAEVAQLTGEAGGISPGVAYQSAVQDLLAARNDPTNAIAPLSVLERRVSDLEPLDRRFRQIQLDLDALNAQLASRSSSVRDASSALALIELERENPLIITRVVTEETSRIAGLLTGLLLFAIPAAVLTILAFFIFDLLRPKPEVQEVQAQPFDAAGELTLGDPKALPEAKTTLTVVEEGDEYQNFDEYDDYDDPDYDEDVLATETDDVSEAMEVESEELNTSEHSDDDPDGDKKSKDKDGRWGRNAGSKAG